MNDPNRLHFLKDEIKKLYQQRESLKALIENGNISGQQGLRELEPIDKKLSALDLEYKTLWDSNQQKN